MTTCLEMSNLFGLLCMSFVCVCQFVFGRSAGAMGKFSVPGRYYACRRCGRGMFEHFCSRLSFLFFFLPL